MKTITAKATVKADLKTIVSLCDDAGVNELVDWLDTHYLLHKVKFPILEYLCEQCMAHLEAKKHFLFLDELVARDRMGSYVMAGMGLQLLLPRQTEIVLERAKSYMIAGNEWYTCDIIGERVFGHAMLIDFDAVYPEMLKAVDHPNIWVVRAVGTGIHYATKKGLDYTAVMSLFDLLCTQSQRKEFHVKKGMGWAAKTITKHYPEMVRDRKEDWNDAGQWFQTKIEKGFYLSAKYAAKYARD